jgi:formiminoglutamase
MMQPRKWSLIKIPDHQGVMNVGGRVGACYGPRAFDRVFQRMKGRVPVAGALGSSVQVSKIGSDVVENHRHAADAVRDAHREHSPSVVVGGGHDHGYSQLLGISEALGAGKRLGCINLDAHLDVRRPAPVPGSGSPFYLAIEAGVIDPANLIEFGIQSHCNAPELWEYVESKSVEVVRWKELRQADRVAMFRKKLDELAARVDAIVVSLDLDCLSQDHCPGVSAPQAEGFASNEIIAMMELAGGHSKVVSLGIFELSPEHDVQDATARVAATAAYHFIESSLER